MQSYWEYAKSWCHLTFNLMRITQRLATIHLITSQKRDTTLTIADTSPAHKPANLNFFFLPKDLK